MIIDNHAHARPSFKELSNWDYSSVAEINRAAQKRIYNMGVHGQPEIRRVKDNAVVTDAWKILWDEKHWGSWEGVRDVNFRIKGGRCSWEKDGTEYYIDSAKLFAACDPDVLVSLMDKVGIDKAVLQTTPTGSLNKYTARVVNKYPSKLIGLCGVDEERAYTKESIEELRFYVEELGLKGLNFSPFLEWEAYFNFCGDKYDPFWREVNSLGIPVYPGVLYSDPHTYEIEIPRFKRLLEKFPNLTIILVHGYPSSILPKGEIKDSVRKMAVDIVKNHDVYVELLTNVKNYDIRYLYETFGPSKLLWGSEFVQVSQPTAAGYAERLNYLEKNCDYISKNDRDLILGGNVQRIYGI